MKFTLRDMFWLILVAAVASMWWADRARLADRLSYYDTSRQVRMELLIAGARSKPPATVAPIPAAPAPAPVTDPFGDTTTDPFGGGASYNKDAKSAAER